ADAAVAARPVEDAGMAAHDPPPRQRTTLALHQSYLLWCRAPGRYERRRGLLVVWKAPESTSHLPLPAFALPGRFQPAVELVAVEDQPLPPWLAAAGDGAGSRQLVESVAAEPEIGGRSRLVHPRRRARPAPPRARRGWRVSVAPRSRGGPRRRRARGRCGGLAEDEHVFVADELRPLAARDRFARMHDLPERRPRHQVALAHGGKQRDHVLPVREPRLLAEAGGGAGEVAQRTLLAEVLGDDDQEAARLQHRRTRPVDVGHRVFVAAAAGVAEVGGVAAVVAVAGGAEVAARTPGLLVEFADLARIRRRGEDEIGDTDTEPDDARRCVAVEEVAGVAGEQAWQLAGVADEHAGAAVCAVVVGVGDVGVGECGPARFELDPEGVPAEMDRFDDGGADAAE